MKTHAQHEEEVWRACIGEPDWQAALRKNDAFVTHMILVECYRQRYIERRFHARLTAQDLNWLREIRVGVLR